MSASESTSEPVQSALEARCRFAWCTTPHGDTLDRADEDHRSDGLPVAIVTRAAFEATSGSAVDAEIGLLRRRTDDDTWFVIEDGVDVHLEITLESARRLLLAVASDPALVDALGFGESDP